MRLHPNVHCQLERPCYLLPDLGFLPELALYRIPGGLASSCVHFCMQAAKPVSTHTHTDVMLLFSPKTLENKMCM